jgi:inosose dehydratase
LNASKIKSPARHRAHALLGNGPLGALQGYADRVDYIHFKDLDPRLYADMMGRRIRFFEACAEGVMCPIGRGAIDYPATRALLSRIG